MTSRKPADWQACSLKYCANIDDCDCFAVPSCLYDSVQFGVVKALLPYKRRDTLQSLAGR
jgi:hypothetical protein